MRENTFEAVRLLPREDLERFAIRAAMELRSHRSEIEAGNVFLAILVGFLLGATVAAAGFILGLGLG
ncbi:MAG: hypothetical protein IOC86_16250 [Aestuariivirga sp.]|nr:hypothetical protein [Aestuariivirga sp.]